MLPANLQKIKSVKVTPVSSKHDTSELWSSDFEPQSDWSFTLPSLLCVHTHASDLHLIRLRTSTWISPTPKYTCTSLLDSPLVKL